MTAAGLNALHALDDGAARAALLRCCGSTRWAAQMAKQRPFSSVESLLAVADATWSALAAEDWLEAFAAHPRLGSRRDVEAKSASTRAWSEQEQSGVAGAAPEVQRALADANAAYEAKFGRVYLACATGKSAEELLALCRARLANDAQTELAVAAEEQRKITRLRLHKLLEA
ncbi:MAG: 2-oxo-4-hydroxy-4-carboxy-5-ureidoimidazoline decarboxylase [Polyangiales bacterium]